MQPTMAELANEYLNKVAEAKRLRKETEALRWKMICLQPVKIGQRARRKGCSEEYLVFKTEFQYISQQTGEPVFCYTLTKPRKDGTMPLMPIKPEYALSNEIELLISENQSYRYGYDG